jgi:hypothetical protein
MIHKSTAQLGIIGLTPIPRAEGTVPRKNEKKERERERKKFAAAWQRS